jgi:antirestriction protein ArdC
LSLPTTHARNLEAGIEITLDNSAAYLKGWLEALKGDARLIVTAASAAQRAADFIFYRNAQETIESEPPSE